MHETHSDILIVGGSTGGCAAAMAAASLGHHVILTEETDWSKITSEVSV
jgi:glycerol-3-phosphate dehydrogenase